MGARWFLSRRRSEANSSLKSFPYAVRNHHPRRQAGSATQQCLHVIVAKGGQANPIRTEFQRIVRSQAIGLSVGEAGRILPESMPVRKSTFFVVVINLQQQAGGNLRALSNLARVTAEMRLVAALSAEAKASGRIIGPAVRCRGLVTLTRPGVGAAVHHRPSGSSGSAYRGRSLMSVGVFSMNCTIQFD